jgi:creatinine amidohydrolase
LRFGDLTYLEIRERAKADWLALVPTGCTEQQGPHLTVDFDTWFVEAVALAAAERAAREYGVHTVVLPALPFGPTPEHRGFGSGYVDIPVDLHDELITSVLDSLAEQGFRRIVVWRGCGGHDLKQAVEQFNERHEGKTSAFLPAVPYRKIWCRVGDPNVPGGHADSFTTSIALYRRPEMVRVDRIADPETGPVDWNDPQLDFAQYSRSGVIGDPTHASAALGEELWEEITATMARMLSDLRESGFTSTIGTEPL